VLFQDYVENKLAIAANGALRLPADVEVTPGKWITKLDRHSPSRRQLLKELVSEQLGVYDRLTSNGKVVVTRISGHQDLIEPDAVSMTDWLRIMVQEEATRDPSHSAAKEALNHLELRPREALTVAASRLVKLNCTGQPYRNQTDHMFQK